MPEPSMEYRKEFDSVMLSKFIHWLFCIAIIIYVDLKAKTVLCEEVVFA